MNVPPVSVVGSLIADLVAQLDRWPALGETRVGQSLAIIPGGKGLNQAVSASRLGCAVTFVGRVGADEFGGMLTRALDDEQIGTRYVSVSSTQATGVAIPFLFPGGENAILTFPQANMTLTAADVRLAAEALSRSRVLLLQLETTDEACCEAARIVASNGGKVILDPAPYRPLHSELMRHVDILTPNLTELEGLTGRPCSSADEVRDSVAQLLEEYPRLHAVVVTMGKDGALVGRPDAHLAIPAPIVDAIDPTAAGDAFNGALAAQLASGTALEQASQVAVVAGALAVTKVGAVPSIPTLAEVRSMQRAMQA
ncbi:MAG: ribokinase [Firmicutes bacterium]|nr:ribokinase [Bacillota bacterium]